MKHIHSDTGLTMIDLGNKQWGLGFRPDATTLCIGSFKLGNLKDVFDEGEVVYIRFNEDRKPTGDFESINPKYEIKQHEVKCVMGLYFVYMASFFKNHLIPIPNANNKIRSAGI